jgi:hypothetical protein
VLLFVSLTGQDQEKLTVRTDVLGFRIWDRESYPPDWPAIRSHSGQHLFAPDFLAEIELVAIGNEISLGGTVGGQLSDASDLDRRSRRKAPSDACGNDQDDDRGHGGLDSEAGDLPMWSWRGRFGRFQFKRSHSNCR